jgi:hypothetical protein
MDAAQLDILRRNSGLAVDREGRVHHQGEVMSHARVADTFAHGLDLDDRGEAIVRIGSQWAYVRCDRTPFVVVRAHLGDGVLRAQLNTGEVLELPAMTLELLLEGDHDLFVRIHDRRHEARFGRTAWTILAEAMVERDGRLVLPLGHAEAQVVRRT